MKTTADAVVIGGGVIGCSILYHLAHLGITNTSLVEKDVLGSGSTGRSQAICRMHYSNLITSTLAWESLKTLTDFSEIIGGRSGFIKTGYMVIVDQADRRGLEKNISMQQAIGIDCQLISREEATEIAPMISTYDGELMAWEPQSGYADSYQVTASFANSAKMMGAEIILRNQVENIVPSTNDLYSVITTMGTIETPLIVVAAGPWSKQLLMSIGIDIPLTTVRHQVASIARPTDLIPTHPSVGDAIHNFSFRPEVGGLTLVGFGEEDAMLDQYNQGIDIASVNQIMPSLISRMPHMEDAYFRGGWSGLFTVTPDWHPILDKIPGHTGIYCAVGFSGHGFKLAPAVGQAMSELIVHGQSSQVDISILGFNRFALKELLTSSYQYNVLA